MKRIATISTLCAFGSIASAWSIFAGAGAFSSSTELIPTTTATEAEVAVAPPGLCVRNFSKDDCEGVVEPGFYEEIGCDTEDCRTIRVTDAVYKTYLKTSGQACGGSCESRCDEFPDGSLTLKFDYVLRADSCCPYRGSWEGEWEYKTDTGLVYGGTAHGTIGVGTNRKSECLATPDDCERCYDVIPSGSQWLIGMEGSFNGRDLTSPSEFADELDFTCDGTWIVSNRIEAPFKEKFRILNRLDGAFLDYCD